MATRRSSDTTSKRATTKLPEEASRTGGATLGRPDLAYPGSTPLEEVVVPGVTQRDVQKLIKKVREEGGRIVGDEDDALIEMSCFTAKAQYDRPAQLLILEPLQLMPNLRPRRLRRVIEQMLAPPIPPVKLDSGVTVHKPTPYTCAVYNWVIGFFTNNSGGLLTYSASNTEHGNLEVMVSRVEAGANPDQHTDGYWRCYSLKDSVVGAYGSISYGLADGVTTMTVYYELNTLSSRTATVALSGQNASRYIATCTLETEFTNAAAYIYPYVRLEKV